jgi:hypothetical protein
MKQTLSKYFTSRCHKVNTINGRFKTAARMYMYVYTPLIAVVLKSFLIYYSEKKKEKVAENTVSDFILKGRELRTKLSPPETANLSRRTNLPRYSCTVLRIVLRRLEKIRKFK